jgi:hypothetical protein
MVGTHGMAWDGTTRQTRVPPQGPGQGPPPSRVCGTWARAPWAARRGACRAPPVCCAVTVVVEIGVDGWAAGAMAGSPLYLLGGVGGFMGARAREGGWWADRHTDLRLAVHGNEVVRVRWRRQRGRAVGIVVGVTVGTRLAPRLCCGCVASMVGGCRRRSNGGSRQGEGCNGRQNRPRSQTRDKSISPPAP